MAEKKEEKKREGVALCLSGGGFRASLFHLGALRRLNQLGVLSSLKTITSVSGGSIVSAHLAHRVQPWPEPGTSFADWDEKVAKTFHRFTSMDSRTWPFLKRWVLPWNWVRPSVQTKALMRRYKKYVTGLTLKQLPEKPGFIFCATDIVFGVNWIFEKKRAGDWQAGYLKSPEWPVAFAVAASSCFPPVFDPMRIPRGSKLSVGGFPGGPERDKLIAKLRLTDGGVYDNLGFEPVWKNHKTVLVSDGGAPFRLETNKTPLGRMTRCFSVIGKQSGAIRRRWLIGSFEDKNIDMTGTYWGIGGAATSYDATQGYSKKLAKEVISRVRTDLDPFTEAETAVLENHAYFLADAAIKRHAPDLITIDNAPLEPPYPAWMDETKVREALAQSHKRFSLKRMFKRK